MNRLVPLVGFVALIVGLALGWTLHDRSPSAVVAEIPVGAATGAPAQASAPTRATDEAIARSVREGELRDLREENKRLRAQAENHELRDLGEEMIPAGMLKLENISIAGYSGNGASLNPELARFFGLSPEQEAEINAEIRAVYEERQRKLLENARVESSTPDKVEIKSTAFTEAARAMHERIRQAVLRAAGHEVGEQLLYFLSGPRAERFQSGFDDYTITFEKIPGSDGKPLFRRTETGGGGSSSATSGDMSVFRAHAAFHRFLPPGFLPPDGRAPVNGATAANPAGSSLSRPKPTAAPVAGAQHGVISGVPMAIAVEGKPGLIISPYATNSGYIDVRGFPPGAEVKCPYSGKMILVP